MTQRRLAHIHTFTFKMNSYCATLGFSNHFCRDLQETRLLQGTMAIFLLLYVPLLLAVLFALLLNTVDLFINGWGDPGDLGPWLQGRHMGFRNAIFPFFVIAWAWLVGLVFLAARPG